jgi:uncharacterized protein YbaP (TraB family)
MKRTMLAIVLVLIVATWASAASMVLKAHRGNSVIYLGGTCHILRESDYPLPPEFDKAYQASQIVVLETDIGKFQDPATQQRMLSKVMYLDGSTIGDHLSARTYAELRSYCEKNGVPLESLQQLKPSMLMTTLVLLEMVKMGVTQHGVDTYYYDLAKRDNKPVEGLEAVDEQIDYIASMADGVEDAFVTHALQDMKSLPEEFASMTQAWRQGDTEKLNELMISEFKTKYPMLYRQLIVNRNRNWLEKIKTYRKSPQTRFILVGMAHLVGPDGLIEALMKMGYKVEKL